MMSCASGDGKGVDHVTSGLGEREERRPCVGARAGPAMAALVGTFCDRLHGALQVHAGIRELHDGR